MVSNNDLLHRHLGPKLISAPHCDDPQRFGTPSHGTPQLADRQIRNFSPYGFQSPIHPTCVYVVLGPPVTLEAMYECDRREALECGDVSFEFGKGGFPPCVCLVFGRDGTEMDQLLHQASEREGNGS